MYVSQNFWSFSVIAGLLLQPFAPLCLSGTGGNGHGQGHVIAQKKHLPSSHNQPNPFSNPFAAANQEFAKDLEQVESVIFGSATGVPGVYVVSQEPGWSGSVIQQGFSGEYKILASDGNGGEFSDYAIALGASLVNPLNFSASQIATYPQEIQALLTSGQVQLSYITTTLYGLNGSKPLDFIGLTFSGPTGNEAQLLIVVNDLEEELEQHPKWNLSQGDVTYNSDGTVSLAGGATVEDLLIAQMGGEKSQEEQSGPCGAIQCPNGNGFIGVYGNCADPAFVETFDFIKQLRSDCERSARQAVLAAVLKCIDDFLANLTSSTCIATLVGLGAIILGCAGATGGAALAACILGIIGGLWLLPSSCGYEALQGCVISSFAGYGPALKACGDQYQSDLSVVLNEWCHN